MIKTISSAAGLSKVYTSITLWSNTGLTNRHIMAISGHRSEQSLVHYNQRPSTSQLKRSSEVLSEFLGDHVGHNQALAKKPAVGLTVTKATTVACSDFRTSSSASISLQGLPDFSKMFNNCSIATVNMNFNRQL